MLASRPSAAHGRPARRSRWWLAALVAVASLLLGAQLIRLGGSAAQPVRMSGSVAPPTGDTFASSSSAAAPAPPPAAPVLRLSGSVPVKGTGTFAYAPGRGPVLGGSGGLKHFRVAVERGSGEDLTAFAAEVERILGDPRSWVGDGTFRLQRVPGTEQADFTVYLATRDTAARMCELGGTNIRRDGRPYTSCRATGRAIVNLDRWRLSAPPYVSAKVPLRIYREYVINHEVGHELGHHHEGCPKRGGPAPVMLQQTLMLRGCTPYAWPRHGGHRLTGPQL